MGLIPSEIESKAPRAKEWEQVAGGRERKREIVLSGEEMIGKRSRITGQHSGPLEISSQELQSRAFLAVIVPSSAQPWSAVHV